jgi:hypothetical protein
MPLLLSKCRHEKLCKHPNPVNTGNTGICAFELVNKVFDLLGVKQPGPENDGHARMSAKTAQS